MRILVFIIFLLIMGCSKEFKVSDIELKELQEMRNKKVMLEDGSMIIPPHFDDIPQEKDSEYETKKDKKI